MIILWHTEHRHIGWYTDNRHGAGSGQIWLDDVDCSGTETNIADCRHQDWGRSNCEHNEDVSIACLESELIITLVLPNM